MIEEPILIDSNCYFFPDVVDFFKQLENLNYYVIFLNTGIEKHWNDAILDGRSILPKNRMHVERSQVKFISGCFLISSSSEMIIDWQQYQQRQGILFSLSDISFDKEKFSTNCFNKSKLSNIETQSNW